MSNKNLIILPTYNEIENIPKIIPNIFKFCPNVHILVVDDNSPDGTSQFVRDNFVSSNQVFVLDRTKKEGLGRAYLAGMQWAIEKKYDFVVQMDADFSHRPIDLKLMIEESTKYDLIIGSRWVPSGAVENWGIMRKFISRFGSFYASQILRKSIKDWTGGFNLWRVSKLKTINFDAIKSNGYSFQIEMKSIAAKNNFNILELPILFVDRVAGQSKMSKKIILEALFKVWTFR